MVLPKWVCRDCVGSCRVTLADAGRTVALARRHAELKMVVVAISVTHRNVFGAAPQQTDASSTGLPCVTRPEWSGVASVLKR